MTRKLRSATEELTGRLYDFRFRLDETETPRPSKPTVAAMTAERRATSLVDADPFVQQILTIFGGTVVEVRDAVAENAGTPETADV